MNVSVHKVGNADEHAESDDEMPLTYDAFLQFSDPSVYAEYREFKMATMNPFLAMVTMLMGLVLLATSGNGKEYAVSFFAWVSRGQGLSMGFIDVNEATNVFVFCLQMVTAVSAVTALISRNLLRDASKMANEAPIFQIAANIATVVGGFTPAFRTLLKVIRGPCLPDTPFAASVACNSACRASDFPTERLLVGVAAILFMQVFVRAASPAATAAGWVAHIAVLNAAMAYLRTPLWMHINLVMFVLAACSYEIERCYMNFFVDRIKTAKFQKHTIKQHLEEETRALEAKRTMVRHIAHEVRTPLNIIAVATDIILTELRKLTAIPAYLIDTVESCQVPIPLAARPTGPSHVPTPRVRLVSSRLVSSRLVCVYRRPVQWRAKSSTTF